MSRSITKIIRVLLASPGDLDVERDAVAEAVDELNVSLAPSQNVRLELIRWETHVTPSLGNDPQDVVNQQIGSDYEVFIGVLWTRFGTPTPRAESGTIEEFERAKARWIEDPEGISVAFYFKEEPLSPSDIDPHQLAKVLAFREALSSTAIYGTFVSADDLARLVRVHLTKHVLGVGEKINSTASSEAAEPEQKHDSDQDVSVVVEAEDDEEGLLDLIEQASESFNGTQNVLSQMTRTMEMLTESIEEAGSGVEAARTQSGEIDTKKAKKAVNDLANKMNIVASRFEADIPVFRESFSGAVEAFNKATEVSLDFGAEAASTVRENREAVLRLVEHSHSAMEMVANLRESTDNLPRITTTFNRSRKRLSSVLAEIQREFSAAHTLISEAVTVVDETLDRLEEPEEEG